MPWTLDEEYAKKQPEMKERAVWLRVIALCLQQLSDKGDAMDSEAEYLEKQQEAEERAAPVIVPPPVQLRCTLVVSNEGATAPTAELLRLRNAQQFCARLLGSMRV